MRYNDDQLDRLPAGTQLWAFQVRRKIRSNEITRNYPPQLFISDIVTVDSNVGRVSFNAFIRANGRSIDFVKFFDYQIYDNQEECEQDYQEAIRG